MRMKWHTISRFDNARYGEDVKVRTGDCVLIQRQGQIPKRTYLRLFVLTMQVTT